MMLFEEFVNDIEKGVAAIMEDGYEVTVKKVPKYNGLILTGLAITKKDSRITPIIYLDGLYQSYISGNGEMSLASVADSIAASYEEHGQKAQQLDGSLGNLEDYQKVRDKVAFRLMNTKENQELLRWIPSIPFHDLSIVFYLYIEEIADGICTALIHNEHMNLWNVTEAELYREAERNTPRLLPETLMGIDKVMESLGIADMGGNALHSCSGLPGADVPLLYVLSNRLGIGGAACLLYPGVMKECADQLRSDLLILPSSTHELLLMGYNETINVDEMKAMVRAVNAAEVPVEDRLSGEVYVYYRLKGQMVMAG